MAPPETGRILDTLSSLKSGLNPVGVRIANYILTNARTIARHSISGLALNAKVGEASVVRFCKTLGYTGFHEFKIALAIETSASGNTDKNLLDTDISGQDKPKLLGQKLQNTIQNALTETLNLIDYTILETCSEAIRTAARIFLVGVGTSANTALYAKHKLTRIGLNVDCVSDIHFAYMKAALLGTDDIAIGISHGGESHETVRTIQLARTAGATTIAITHSLTSTLAKGADFVLFNGNRQGELQGDSIATKTAQLMVIELLYSLLILGNVEKARSIKSRTTHAIGSGDTDESDHGMISAREK